VAELTPSLRLEIGQFSDPGRKRANNEDWLGAFQPEDALRLTSKGSLFLVADGMGGHQSGEMASRRAVDHVIRTYLEDSSADVQASLAQAIRSANSALYGAASERGTGQRWGTTLVAAVVRNEELWIANVGDSRAYLIHNGKIRRLTQDHSWAGMGRGREMEGDWIGRHIVTRALGLRPEVEVDLFPAVRLVPGDRVLLCSDGLSAPLDDDLIGDIARRRGPQQAAEALVATANSKGGPDNVSVVLIEMTRRQKGRVLDMLAGWIPPRLRLQAASPVGQRVGEKMGSPSGLWLVLLFLIALVLVGIGFLLGLVIF
jgi:serine/threonine protein phosphatase PrpC